MNGSRGKKAFLLSGAMLLAVLLAASFSWKEFVIAYHDLRLRREPKYLFRLAEAPEGSLKYQALMRFLKSKEGPEALTEILKSQLIQSSGDFSVVMKGEDKVIIGINPLGVLLINSPSPDISYPNQPHLQKILQLYQMTAWIENRSFQLPEYPEFVFTVLPGEIALPTTGYSSIDRKDWIIVARKLMGESEPPNVTSPPPAPSAVPAPAPPPARARPGS